MNIYFSVFPTIILGVPPPFEGQVHFIFSIVPKSQKKSFNVTFPIEQVYTLFFY